jgi:streptogramin lyase
VDGIGTQAKLQHPQGLAWGAGALWVADTYNSKIKRIDPVTGEVKTVAGDGSHDPLFDPGGLAYEAGPGGEMRLWVADSSHDRIVTIDAETGVFSRWELTGIETP